MSIVPVLVSDIKPNKLEFSGVKFVLVSDTVPETVAEKQIVPMMWVLSTEVSEDERLWKTL